MDPRGRARSTLAVGQCRFRKISGENRCRRRRSWKSCIDDSRNNESLVSRRSFQEPANIRQWPVLCVPVDDEGEKKTGTKKRWKEKRKEKNAPRYEAKGISLSGGVARLRFACSVDKELQATVPVINIVAWRRIRAFHKYVNRDVVRYDPRALCNCVHGSPVNVYCFASVEWYLLWA